MDDITQLFSSLFPPKAKAHKRILHHSILQGFGWHHLIVLLSFPTKGTIVNHICIQSVRIDATVTLNHDIPLRIFTRENLQSFLATRALFFFDKLQVPSHSMYLSIQVYLIRWESLLLSHLPIRTPLSFFLFLLQTQQEPEQRKKVNWNNQ